MRLSVRDLMIFARRIGDFVKAENPRIPGGGG